MSPYEAASSLAEHLWALGSRRVEWARPLTFTYILAMFWITMFHFVWRHRHGSWRQYYMGSTAVRLASSPSVRHIGKDVLFVYRLCVFLYCFWSLLDTSIATGPSCLRFFTVWNFTALVCFFALGTGLSFSCCRDVAQLRSPPSRVHRAAAALHHILLEVQLPMAAMIALVVWLVLYPYDAMGGAEHPDATAYRLSQYTNLTSLTMHAANLIFMLVEFGLDALHVAPGHMGLVVAWGMLYALFNGLQAYFTNDTVYFFTDFTLAKTPLVAVLLTSLMGAIFTSACALSRLKWRLLLGADHPRNPHAADATGCAACCASEGAAPPTDELAGADSEAGDGGGGWLAGSGRVCDASGHDHPSVPYTQFTAR